MSVVMIRNSAASGGGADVTPTAVNWANISEATSGSGSNATQTIAAIDTAITLRAEWTVSGSTPTVYVYRNGALLTSSSTSPIDFSVSVGQTVSFVITVPASGSASGTVTVKNQSDGAATLDTFTYSVTSVVTNDATPSAIDWTDTGNGVGTGIGSTNTPTISGIDVPITLRLSWTVSGNPLAAMYVSVNGSAAASGATSPLDFVVSNGQTVGFSYTNFTGYFYDTVSTSGTATVTNLTDGGATLDTFTYDVSWSGIPPP